MDVFAAGHPSKAVTVFVLVRALTYAALFIGFVLVYLPARFLAWSGVVRPAIIGAPQVGGDDHGNDRNGACALVLVHLRVHWERHTRAVRSAKKTRDPWAVSFRA